MSTPNVHVHAQAHATSEQEQEERSIVAERYKTKLCKNFVATGACRYDIRCMFAHGEHELRTAEQNMEDGLVTEEAIKAMQHQVQAQQRSEARSRHYPAFGRQSHAAMLPPPPPFHEEHTLVAMPAPRMIHNPYLLDLLPRECHLYTYPAGYSDAMSVSSRSSYDYFPEAGSQCSERASPVEMQLATHCQKNMSVGDFEDSMHDVESEGRVMEP